jgi:hypothetical protein
VTTKAAGLLAFRIRVGAFDSLHDFLMTLPAGLFSHFTTAGGDVDVVLEPTRREIVGVPETVACFGGVLCDETWRSVAVVADGDGTVTRLNPAVELVLHDVAVYTCFSIVGHVRITAGVDERIRTDTQQHTYRDSQDNSWH